MCLFVSCFFIMWVWYGMVCSFIYCWVVFGSGSVSGVVLVRYGFLVAGRGV